MLPKVTFSSSVKLPKIDNKKKNNSSRHIVVTKEEKLQVFGDRTVYC
jgi:hypothetical protein